MRRAAAHVQKDDALGLRREVRLLRRERVGGRGGTGGALRIGGEQFGNHAGQQE